MAEQFDEISVRLLADSDRAQRLVGAWPAVKRCRTKKDFDRWAAIALVPSSAARTLGAALIAAGICGEGGAVPERARAIVIAASVSRATSRSGQQRKKRTA